MKSFIMCLSGTVLQLGHMMNDFQKDPSWVGVVSRGSRSRLSEATVSFRDVVAVLANLTSEEALELFESPAKVSLWLEKMGLGRAPKGFWETLEELAADAEKARAAAETAANVAGRATAANRRRGDVAELQRVLPDCLDRLPLRLRQVYVLCIDQGRTLAEAAAALEISVPSVRTHLRRLRELARRNAHVKPVDRKDAFAALGYGRG